MWVDGPNQEQPDSGMGRGKLTSTLMNLITNMDFLFLKLFKLKGKNTVATGPHGSVCSGLRGPVPLQAASLTFDPEPALGSSPFSHK